LRRGQTDDNGVVAGQNDVDHHDVGERQRVLAHPLYSDLEHLPALDVLQTEEPGVAVATHA
jgi:hypothetical protein